MSTTETTTRPTGTVQRFPVTLAVVGAMCSAAVLAAEGASLTTRLVGTAVGAAIPPLVGAAAPGHNFRVTVAVLLTAVAVVLGYGGDQLLSGVTGKEPSLPTPNEIVQYVTEPPTGPEPAGPEPAEPEVEKPGSAGPIVMTEGSLEITITPGAITCEADGGCDTVTVTSTGPLRVTWLEFEGEASSYLSATGCEDTLLEPDQSCAITLAFSPDAAPEEVATRLVIHQNLQGQASCVSLAAAGSGQVVANIALGQPSCDSSGLLPDPDGGAFGELRVEAPISVAGLADGSSVDAVVLVDGAPWWEGPVEVDGPPMLVLETYGGAFPQEVLVRLDPANRVAESEEVSDNEATTSC